MIFNEGQFPYKNYNRYKRDFEFRKCLYTKSITCISWTEDLRQPYIRYHVKEIMSCIFVFYFPDEEKTNTLSKVISYEIPIEFIKYEFHRLYAMIDVNIQFIFAMN